MGYARVATLGEEVRDPERTSPLALGITLAVYAAVTISALLALGPDQLAVPALHLRTPPGRARSTRSPPQCASARPSPRSVSCSPCWPASAGPSSPWARDRELPRYLSAVHPRHHVPHRAELAVAAMVVIVATTSDLREAIGFISFTVLTYYAIANASAWTLEPERRRWPKALAATGLVGCAALAVSLPVSSVLAGAGVLAAGALLWAARHRLVAGRGEP